MSNSLLTPLYANKPKRRIPGTNFVAVTMYRSNDGTVRQYAIFTADGEASLGTAYYQPKNRVRPTRYTMVPVDRYDSERWLTLADFATEMATRLGVETKEA
jgi:hypothetical protein